MNLCNLKTYSVTCKDDYIEFRLVINTGCIDSRDWMKKYKQFIEKHYLSFENLLTQIVWETFDYQIKNEHELEISLKSLYIDKLDKIRRKTNEIFKSLKKFNKFLVKENREMVKC